MKVLHFLLLGSVLLAARPHDMEAQSGGRRLEPFVGLAVGGSKVPEAFAGCLRGPRAAGEMRAGMAGLPPRRERCAWPRWTGHTWRRTR